jgi:hypothetical protein
MNIFLIFLLCLFFASTVSSSSPDTVSSSLVDEVANPQATRFIARIIYDLPSPPSSWLFDACLGMLLLSLFVPGFPLVSI